MEKKNVIKIAILGAESTGKSTLCEQLALHYNTVFVREYARQYFTKKKNIDDYSLNDLETIYVHQIENEKKALLTARRFLFCDTTLITGKIWTLEEFKTIPGFISQNISKIKYDLYLLTSNEVHWKKDPLRKNPDSRDHHYQRNIEELKLLQANYRVVEGLNEQRLKNAIKHIDGLF
ncbi:MAG TPA: AAA family ATPase [Bacteroidia bacterium]|nr:AAA family ATPase [Bacteroidia bacterium]